MPGSLFFCPEPELPMRPLILIAMTALALAACRGKGEADANRSADAGLTAENIVSNDVTAIDAVTADAANMAADVNYADALSNLSNNSSDSKSPAKPRAKPRSSAPAPAESPAQTPADSTTNAE